MAVGMGGSGSDLLEPLPIQTIIRGHQQGKNYSIPAVLPNTLLRVLQY